MLAGATSFIRDGHPDAVHDPLRPVGTREGREIYRGREVVDVEDYLTDVFTEEAVRFIDRHAGVDDPFFLIVSYNAPHTPLQAMREDMDAMAHVVEDFQTRIYATMVSTVDRGVGAIVDRLEWHGVADDTLIVFMSDNGCVGYAAIDCSNGPLRGSKRFHLEGGIRIPLLIHWPNGIDAGRVFRDPVISLDLFATFATVAGVAAVDVDDRDVIRDGVDLLPYLTGRTDGPPHDVLVLARGTQPGDAYGSVETVSGESRPTRRGRR